MLCAKSGFHLTSFNVFVLLLFSFLFAINKKEGLLYSGGFSHFVCWFAGTFVFMWQSTVQKIKGQFRS